MIQIYFSWSLLKINSDRLKELAAVELNPQLLDILS